MFAYNSILMMLNRLQYFMQAKTVIFKDLIGSLILSLQYLLH